MRRIRINGSLLAALAASLLLGASWAGAQALIPEEIKDPAARGLQRKYQAQLKSIGDAVRAHPFRYPFYFSRILGAGLEQQRRMDQRSIHFEKYSGQMLLEFIGNYYASYSTELMDRNQRARQTFLDVMLPVLKATTPLFTNDENVHGYALEISHHVRRSVLGVTSENTENVMVILPRPAAERLVAAKTAAEQQGILLEGQAFLNAEPVVIWMSGEQPPEAVAASPQSFAPAPASPPSAATPKPAGEPAPPGRPVTKESLARLEDAHAELLARLVKEMEPRARFVSYAPPTFIEFHQGVYLQLTMVTTLEASAAGSRYKQAALAFDEHIASLIRPVLALLPKDADFEGVNFSTTVRLPAAEKSLSVEFIFPLAALRSYAQYDYTGQQLINSAYVLINGERAALDLQTAEATR